MVGENVTNVADAAKDKDEDNEGRQRSSIGFPYSDLGSAIDIAQAIHNNVGLGDCEDDQLASWTSQSPKSSGYRTQVTAARMFGLTESSGGRYRLTELGRMVVDPQRAREGRVRAFLNVPLFIAVFEKYKGGVLPPTAAFERDLEVLGVAPKMKDRARRVLERSAEQAGFFEQGRNRLVRPGVAVREDQPSAGPAEPSNAPETENRFAGSGGGGGNGSGPEVDPIIRGLLARLPKSGDVWPEQERKLWLQLLEGSFKLIYKDGTSTPQS